MGRPDRRAQTGFSDDWPSGQPCGLLHSAAVDRFDCKLDRILGRAADG